MKSIQYMKKPRIDFKKMAKFNQELTMHMLDASAKNYLSPIVKNIEKNITNPDIVDDLKIYFIIRMITLLENFFGSLAVRLVDIYNCPINNLFDDNNIQIPIQNLDEIKKHDVTKGKIIASSFNFQTRHDINHVFSILLEIKFLDEVKSIPMAKRYRNNKFVKWDKYLDLFSLRHKIVHDVSAKVNFSSTEINDISRATELFTYLSSVTVFVQLYKKYPTVLKKDLPGIYQFTEDLYGE